jgi:squalene-hopene/tetraprenyl-beta-curcumene cyclase
MNRILHGALVLLAAAPLLASACVPAQAGAGDKRKHGTIYKSEVDSLIKLLRDSERAQHLPALGGDSVVATARVLVAMGHCHRRYHKSDGPVVRPSLQFLIENRRSDGSFGDAEATVWVIDALEVMDPDGYREEVAHARRWLEQHEAVGAGFEGAKMRVLESVRADVFPEQIGAPAAQRASQWAGGAQFDRGDAAMALVELVACQAANRDLDRAQDGASGGGGFTAAQQKAFSWLESQLKDGVYHVNRGGKELPDPALTGFALLALQTKPQAQRTADEQAMIEQGLRWLLGAQNADGTFGQYVQNYTTCVAVAALSRWQDPAVKAALEKAQKAILGFQNIENSGYERSDRDYGSIGYGGSQRGDLSNLHFSLEALKKTGLPADHEAFTKALVFLQRTQNLRSVNDFSGKVPDPDREGVILDATSGDDGGAAYYPGNSAAGYVVLPDGKSVPRSYGSMTYALLKSYTLAGLPGDDPRVQAAVKWIQQNWTLAVNPGADPALGEKVQYQGLFYYYMVLAQALDAAGIEKVTVREMWASGKEQAREVDWRKALRGHLEKVQSPDGTWVNGKNGRWMEDVPLLCTCYSMVALELCH